MKSAAVVIAGLSKKYGRSVALTSLDLEVQTGEVLGYLGPNGAGKTTTLRILIGAVRPSSGGAEIFGVDAWLEAPRAHTRLAYVPGEAKLWPSLTGAETLQLLGRTHSALDTTYREELVQRFELDPSKKVRAYSMGNRQKVVLVAALASRADLLLLDEPTNGLDPLMEQEFRRCIAEARKRGQTVFLSSHKLSEVEALCDRVALLRAGRLVEVGTLEEMRHLSASSVEVTFDGPPPDLSRVPGVSSLVAEDHVLRFQLRGNIEPLLEALAGSRVVNLLTREPSLEEIFLARYGRNSEDSSTAPVGGG